MAHLERRHGDRPSQPLGICVSGHSGCDWPGTHGQAADMTAPCQPPKSVCRQS